MTFAKASAPFRILSDSRRSAPAEGGLFLYSKARLNFPLSARRIACPFAADKSCDKANSPFGPGLWLASSPGDNFAGPSHGKAIVRRGFSIASR